MARAHWQANAPAAATPYVTAPLVVPPPSGGDDAPAWAALLAKITTRSGQLVALDYPTPYRLGFNPWAYLGRANGGHSTILGTVETAAQLALPDGHILEFSGRRTNGAGEGGGAIRAAADFVMPADGTRALIRKGPVTGAIVHGIKLLGGLLNAGGVAGLIGVYGDGMQEGCEDAGMILQGFRQCLDYSYGAFGGSHNANIRIHDNEFYCAGPEVTSCQAAAAGAAALVLADNGSARAGDALEVALAAGGVQVVTIESVGASVGIYPVLSGNVNANAQVRHAAPVADVWSGSGTEWTRNTVIPPGVTDGFAPGLRMAGQGWEARLTHAERSRCAVQLGGYVRGWNSPGQSGGLHYSQGLSVVRPLLNANGTAAADVVHVANRDAAAALPNVLDRHRVRGCYVDGETSIYNAVNLIRDEGSTDLPRAPVTRTVAATPGACGVTRYTIS